MPIIRDYKHQDLEDTIRLMKLLSNDLQIKFNEENWRHSTRDRAFIPEVRTLIAEENKKVVGMCFADIQRDELGQFHGLIRNVIVDPAYRNKEIASALIQHAVELFTDLKLNTARVEVSDQIKKVIPLFEKLNFKSSHIVEEINVLKIREYEERDYEATKELMQIYSELINFPFNEDEWKKTIKLRKKEPQNRILVSEKDGVVTGMALLTIDTEETGLILGYLDNVIVHPKYQRLEIGKSLLIRAIETLNVLGVDKIRIMAHLEVKAWLKSFEEVGFHHIASIMELKVGK